ncbi:MAG: pilus assembly protein [Lentisphaeria bacterium]|nr:pilus assembly protein [Lentisphaeria bacterium]
MLKRWESFLKERKGAVLLEFVLCFPILLVLFLFAMQLAQIMITWQVVHYAAYMGARSSMVTNNIQRKSQAEKVVKRILAVVSASPATTSAQNSKDGGKGGNKDADRTKDEYCKLDGWGYLPDTKYLEKQVDVDIPLVDIDPSGVRCTVKFKMFLNVPVAGPLIAFFANPNKKDKDWEKKLDDQANALNPALLVDDPQTVEPEKDLKLPYIELSSTSVVNIPYGTKAYPLEVF